MENLVFFGLKPTLDTSNFNTIHTKDDILFYVLEYNEKYKQFDIPLNYEIDSKKLEEINEIKNEIVEIKSEKDELSKNVSNFFEIDYSGIGFNVGGVSFEVYDGKIVRSNEIEKIERHKEEFILNNVLIYG